MNRFLTKIAVVVGLFWGINPVGAQGQGATTLQAEGMMVLRALAAIDSYAGFARYFVSAADCRVLARQATEKTASDYFYQLAESIEQGAVAQNRVWRVWKQMMETGRPFRVNWSRVEYVDWKYLPKSKSGVQGGVGILVFRYDGRYFLVSPTMYKVGQIYKIAFWGNSAYKVMNAAFSNTVTSSYSNGRYCISEGAASNCLNIAQELNAMTF